MSDYSLRAPNFINIGAQKCASTWLYHCLREHPGIFMGAKQVIKFFEHPHYRQEGWGDYLTHFSAATPEQIIGDSRVEYLYNPESPELIFEHLPDVKLIVLLRNPVERAVSAYLWNVRKALIPDLTLSDGLDVVLSGQCQSYDKEVQDRCRRIIEMGFYAKQMKRYLQLFPMERMLIILHDNIKEDPLDCIQTTCRFLGVDPDFVPSGLTKTPLKSAGIPLITKLEQKTRWLYGSGKVWDWLNRGLLRIGVGRSVPPALNSDVREALEGTYAGPNRDLLELLKDYSRRDSTFSGHLNLERCQWLTAIEKASR